jgi:Ca2+/Na+ antiporter
MLVRLAESLLQLEWEAISSSDIVCRVTFVAGNQNELAESVVMLSCLLLRHRLHLSLIVLTESRRWVGGALLGLYIAFIILEFTMHRR